MRHIEPQRLSLLLCLLVACSKVPEPSSDTEEPVQSLAERQRLASPLVASAWNPTGYLSRGRSGHTATLLSNGKVLVVGGISGGAMLASAELYDPPTGSWTFAGSLARAREGHTATLLPSGKVLVVGGKQDTSILDSAEVYDPRTGTWSSTGSLLQARFGHTAVMLQDKVLVVGGNNGVMALSSAEVYDPTTGAWSPTSPLAQAREHHTATLLPGGQVLVVGGRQGTTLLASSEMYDPGPGVWSPMGTLIQPREYHTATLLPGGKVLVVGGQDRNGAYLGSAEEYNTAADTWSSKGTLAQARAHHSAALLPDGRLLVMGGIQSSGPVSAATEVYDPAAKTWSFAGLLKRSRLDLTATLLPSGEVLAVGGKARDNLPGIIAEVVAEIYTPTTGVWSSAGSISQGRQEHTATLLPDGKVLVVGGGDMQRGVFATVDVYDPLTEAWSSAASLKRARSNHTATLLPNGKVLVAGGYGGTGTLTSAEIFDRYTGEWAFTGPLHQARSNHTATLLPDGKVLVVGGYGTNASLASAEVYDPHTDSWSSTGSLQQARARHTAILLQGTKVLVLGGEEDPSTPLSSAEVYDVMTGIWSPAHPMKISRRLSTATLLPNGKVLVAGGDDGSHTLLYSTELYTPDAGGSLTGSLITALDHPTATLLPGGKVLLAGGVSTVSASTIVEVYDPKTETWSSAGSLTQARQGHTATLLPGGRVLVVGGESGNLLSSAELYANLAGDASRRPLITGVSPSHLEHGTSVTVEGERFRGTFEASSGNTLSSATNHPLVSLLAVESGGWVPLLGHDLSDTTVTATLPYVPNGYYLLEVTTQGLTSSRIISIINNSPPDTLLGSWTPEQETRDTTAAFSFSSTVPASFVCNLDTFIITNCISPQSYISLSEGAHTFRVRAVDLSGNEDPTPAVYTWIIDRTGPETTIDIASAPALFTRDRTSRFAFSSSEEGSSFQCSLDGAASTPCANSQEYSSLIDGAHTFQVQATDRLGNVGSTAEYHWVVDTVPPGQPTIQVQISKSEAVFSGTAEPGGTVMVFIDGAQVGDGVPVNENGGWELRSPPPPDGTYTATAEAKDQAGNLGAPSEVPWVVDTTAPDRPTIRGPAPNEKLFTTSTDFSGTAEPNSTVMVFIDSAQDGIEASVNEHGDWEVLDVRLDWGTHMVEAKAVDGSNNESQPSLTVSFAMVRSSHYGMGCAAAPSALAPWGLLVIGLLRRRSRTSWRQNQGASAPRRLPARASRASSGRSPR